jgi:O-antigen/teichoic acid export membrane protein
MALARKIAYNVVFNSLLKIVTTVALSLLSIRLITGYLGKEGFGDYTTILAFFAFFAAIADLGIGSMTAREISREGAKEKDILGKVASLRLFSSIALFLFVPVVLLFFSYPFPVKIGIWIASGAVIFSSFSIFLNGIFQKNIAMDRIALVEFFGKLIQVGCVFLVVWLDLGFLAIVSTLVVSLVFNSSLAFFLSRKYVTFPFRVDRAYWKTFLRNSLPLGGSALITFFYFKMDAILLSVIQGSAAVGIYGVAYKVMENLTFFPAMLAGLILPILSRHIFSRREVFVEIADTTFRVFSIIVLPLVIGGAFLSADIVSIVSGSGFEESVPVLEMLMFSLAFIFFGHYFIMILIVGNMQKKLMKLLFFVAIFNISVNLFLIPKYSFLGAAATALMTELLVAVSTGILVYRSIGYRPAFGKLGRVLASAALMAGFLFLFSETLQFLLAGFLSVAVYLGALWLFRAVTSGEIAELFSKKEAHMVSANEPL